MGITQPRLFISEPELIKMINAFYPSLATAGYEDFVLDPRTLVVNSDGRTGAFVNLEVALKPKLKT
jgi:hypothetical protein